jgi:DNA polymerase-4
MALSDPTQLTDRIYRHAKMMFDQARQMGPFRLIGVGIAELGPEQAADQNTDLLDPDANKRAATERATDAIRARFGKDAIVKGRALR